VGHVEAARSPETFNPDGLLARYTRTNQSASDVRDDRSIFGLHRSDGSTLLKHPDRLMKGVPS
jgi:hypothetical protein